MAHDRILVPNLSSTDLLNLAYEKLGLTSIDKDLLKSEFIGEARGKVFEVLLSSERPKLLTGEQRLERFFFPEGLYWDSNRAAFIAWLVEKQPAYSCATCHIAGMARDLQFVVGKRKRRLELASPSERWHGIQSFLLFREVKNP